MSCVSENCQPAPADSRPHVVTPAIADEANRLLAEAHSALLRARRLARSIDELETLKDDAYAANRAAIRRASDLLMGPPSVSNGYYSKP